MSHGAINLDSLGRVVLPTTLEVYECDDEKGALNAVPLGGIESEKDFHAAFDALCKESPEKKFIKVKVTRRIINGNFDWLNHFKKRLLK